MMRMMAMMKFQWMTWRKIGKSMMMVVMTVNLCDFLTVDAFFYQCDLSFH